MNERQRLFVEEYLVDLSASQAARRAGYARRSARNTAWKLLRHPEVMAAVRAAMEARVERTRITADRVLKEYARIAIADMRRVCTWGADGVKLKAHTALSDDDAAAIAEIAVTAEKGGRGRVKLHDKKGALDAIARHIGLFDAADAAGPERRLEAANRAREILAARLDELARAKE
jgi:phage terminase small subunit